MRQALPKHAKITDEAKETMVKCVTKFIRVVTSEAKGNREKVINPEALLLRLEKLRLHGYVEPLLAFYDGYLLHKAQINSSNMSSGVPPPPQQPTSTSGSQVVMGNLYKGGSNDGASTSGGGANLDILDQFVDLIINLDDYPDD